MPNFDFKKSSRKCYECDRTFQPGDGFFSVLLETEDGSPDRRDFGVEHWGGPPEDCIGWWKCSVPEIGEGQVYWAPKQVMLAYFESVLSKPATQDIAYVAGLLLCQKRILKMEDNRGNESIMVLKDRSSNNVFEVPVAELTSQRLNEIQEELSERLFMDQPADFENESDFQEIDGKDS